MVDTDEHGWYVASDRYWIIRKLDSQGAIVAKFDGATRIPEEIVDHDSFVIQSVSDRSALVDKSIDQSGLSEDERRLLDPVYPVG